MIEINDIIMGVATAVVVVIVIVLGMGARNATEDTLPIITVSNSDLLNGIFTPDVMMGIVFILALGLVAIAVSIYQRRDDP